MPAWLRWTLGVSIAALIFLVPFFHFRSVYAHGKRFHIVTPGRFYRCGQLTVEGFEDYVRQYGIRTVINVQDEYPDPSLDRSYLDRSTEKESEVCARLQARYIHLIPDLISRRLVPEQRPQAIERLLGILDHEENYPILIHCRAGLHRTGVLCAVYRMEYEGWNKERAIDELKSIGFGEFACSADNDYIQQYILTYRRGVRLPAE